MHPFLYYKECSHLQQFEEYGECIAWVFAVFINKLNIFFGIMCFENESD